MTSRHLLLGLAALLAASAFAGEARAQAPFSSINDPFFAYYSFYLPRQQAQALQPGPEATIAAITANRQVGAATNRNDVFDFSGPGLGSDELGFNSGSRRGALAPGAQPAARIGGNVNGQGPTGRVNGVGQVAYFNNVKQYHPTIRPNIHRNNNVANIVQRRGYSGGFGGVGLPGVR